MPFVLFIVGLGLIMQAPILWVTQDLTEGELSLTGVGAFAGLLILNHAVGRLAR